MGVTFHGTTGITFTNHLSAMRILPPDTTDEEASEAVRAMMAELMGRVRTSPETLISAEFWFGDRIVVLADERNMLAEPGRARQLNIKLMRSRVVA